MACLTSAIRAGSVSTRSSATIAITRKDHHTVNDAHIDIPSADGSINTFITWPDDGEPHPVVLFFMDAPGKRVELHDMARRIGAAGYYVMLPNLYYRTVREFDASDDLDGRVDEVRALVRTLDVTKIATDTAALLAYAGHDPAANATVAGVVGYCMSGPFAYAMAATFPDRIVAAASIHGVRLHGDGSPQDIAHQVRGELYFACAEIDEYVPTSMVDGLERHLADLGVNARVERYPGTHHGFVFPTRHGAYDEAASERHYERLLDLFERNLRR
jgi:carboxymethylenebutenolidase